MITGLDMHGTVLTHVLLPILTSHTVGASTAYGLGATGTWRSAGAASDALHQFSFRFQLHFRSGVDSDIGFGFDIGLVLVLVLVWVWSWAQFSFWVWLGLGFDIPRFCFGVVQVLVLLVVLVFVFIFVSCRTLGASIVYDLGAHAKGTCAL